MKNKKGFTLIELLAVIVILAVIMVIAVPKILDVIESSKNSAADSSIKLVKDAIKTQVTTAGMSGTSFEMTGECYIFDFENNNENAQKLSLKNKEKIGGSIKYCNGKFEEDTLTFAGVDTTEETALDIYPVTTGLTDYFDYNNFKDNVWMNSISTGNNMTISGEASLVDNSVNIDMKNKSTYATLPIDNTQNYITIYLVVKSIEKNSDNARYLEIPKYLNTAYGAQASTTPGIFTTSSSTLGFGVFMNDADTQINALQYNVIALQIDMTTNTLKININNAYSSSISSLNGFGNTLYLSNCTYSINGYGNNNYKMISISYNLHTENEVKENIDWLIQKYID